MSCPIQPPSSDVILKSLPGLRVMRKTLSMKSLSSNSSPSSQAVFVSFSSCPLADVSSSLVSAAKKKL